jgi:hypothetical protein
VADGIDDHANPPGEPLRVLGITSRYTTVLQHSMSELQAAVQSAGASPATSRFEVAIEPDDQSLENPFLEKIASFKPDLIVQISRMRYENPHLPRNVPFLCWDQDNLPVMRTAQATASLDALTYVAGHAPVFGYTNLGWPRRNCIFCHAAAATLRYQPSPVPESLRKKFACDISYVSNASGSPSSLAENLRQRWNSAPALQRLFDALAADVLAKSARGDTWEFVKLRNLTRARVAVEGIALEPAALHELTMALNTLADRAFRHTALEWVARWSLTNSKVLRLYGNGWEANPQFAGFAAGHVSPGEEARAIFQASRINLQLIEPGFIHSRALDGLAAGGFFLTRYTIADGLDSEEVATLYRLAKWVDAHGIQTDAQLDAIADPEVRQMVAATRAYYHRYEVSEPLCPSLHIWAQMPAAACLFPQLKEITFRSAEEFATLADRYLDGNQGDAIRARIAGDMRTIVEDNFSYTARWKTFVAAIRRGLELASSQGA